MSKTEKVDSKKKDKAKVGRPKMADASLIKDSWCKIGCGILAVVIMTVCLVGELTGRTPFQVLTFQKIDLFSGTATMKYDYEPSSSIVPEENDDDEFYDDTDYFEDANDDVPASDETDVEEPPAADNEAVETTPNDVIMDSVEDLTQVD